MDVSGDGTNNTGASVGQASDNALQSGIDTINGIVISRYQNVIDQYVEDVSGGSNAFVMVAEDYVVFEDAIQKKLMAEIQAKRPAEAIAISEPPGFGFIVFGLLLIWALRDGKK